MSYFANFLEFRNKCAEIGVELVPKRAKVLFSIYEFFRKQVKKAKKDSPNFYLELCNRTTEQKLEDIRILKKSGCKMSLKYYNDLRIIMKSICEIENYA